MPRSKSRRFWKITGTESLREIYSRRIPYGSINESRLRELLAALAAKHSLTDDEIVDSYLNPKAKGYRLHLEIQAHSSPYSLSCGPNPEFHARIVEE
jgi:hypothetical protein